MYFGFDDISIAYRRKSVLAHVTVDIPRGAAVTVIGQNGCGKSSLLRTVFGAVKPQTGRVIYENRPLTAHSPGELAQRIAYLPQFHTAPPDLDVRTLVSYGRYPYRRIGHGLTHADSTVIDDALERTGLTALQKQPLGTLSGGERQRARLAMTLCQQPEILLLDEPTTYLDIGYQVELLDLVRGLNRELGMTVLMVLHDLNLAARCSDLLYVLADGSVHTSGPPAQVLTPALLRDVFRVKADVRCDERHGCPYFIPLGNDQQGEYK